MTALPVPTTLRLRFPGRAGELQAAGDADALSAELAADADTYQAFLDERAQALGGEPDPAAYAGRFAAYGTACAAFDDVVSAQTLLSQAAARAPEAQSPQRPQVPSPFPGG
jgi:hypothetical protein